MSYVKRDGTIRDATVGSFEPPLANGKLVRYLDLSVNPGGGPEYRCFDSSRVLNIAVDIDFNDLGRRFGQWVAPLVKIFQPDDPYAFVKMVLEYIVEDARTDDPPAARTAA